MCIGKEFTLIIYDEEMCFLRCIFLSPPPQYVKTQIKIDMESGMGLTCRLGPQKRHGNSGVGFLRRVEKSVHH
jgi:hypothetical protein